MTRRAILPIAIMLGLAACGSGGGPASLADPKPGDPRIERRAFAQTVPVAGEEDDPSEVASPLQTASSNAADAPEPTQSISGRVTDMHGRPLDKICVALYREKAGVWH